MRKILLTAIFSIVSVATFAQCNELFISEYVEGYGNNRALEIYNPTSEAVNMSEYSVGRFSNGSTSFIGIQMADVMLDPYDVYVVALDKRDSIGSGFETPIWNGYQLWDVCIDEVTGEPIVIDDETLYCVQYNEDGLHLYGSEYNEFLDLEGKADEYLCPVYDTNNAMYFNGNDAVALVKGTEVASDGSNLLDVVGVIGEDPADGAWVDADGGWVTKDKTLTRNADVTGGGIQIAATGGSFDGTGWTVNAKNYFDGLGSHTCDCGVASIENLNVVALNVFPNPSTVGYVTIETGRPMVKIEVLNVGGQVVESFLINNAQQAKISTQNLADGVYFIQTTFDNKYQSVEKLIVK